MCRRLAKVDNHILFDDPPLLIISGTCSVSGSISPLQTCTFWWRAIPRFINRKPDTLCREEGTNKSLEPCEADCSYTPIHPPALRNAQCILDADRWRGEYRFLSAVPHSMVWRTSVYIIPSQPKDLGTVYSYASRPHVSWLFHLLWIYLCNPQIEARCQWIHGLFLDVKFFLQPEDRGYSALK